MANGMGAAGARAVWSLASSERCLRPDVTKERTKRSHRSEFTLQYGLAQGGGSLIRSAIWAASSSGMLVVVIIPPEFDIINVSQTLMREMAHSAHKPSVRANVLTPEGT
jgi:hypothetical protein